MTEKKTLKRRVRERMSKTGERYTSARRQLLAKTTERPTTAAQLESTTESEPLLQPEPQASPSAEALHGPTNRTWAQWVRVLDDWGAPDRGHAEIARWLGAEMGVPPWWTQDITVRYEKHIGRRVLRQRAPGSFSATASKTINVVPAVARAAWTAVDQRALWLPDVELAQRPNKVEVSARFDVGSGEGRVIVSFAPKDEGRVVVAVEHEKLPDAEVAERWSKFWRTRLAALKTHLEG